MISDSLKDCNVLALDRYNDVSEFVNHLIKSNPLGFDVYLDRKDLLEFFSEGVLKESKISQYVKNGLRIRIITNITKNDISCCENLLSIGLEIHHVSDLGGGNMILNDKILVSFIIYRKDPVHKGVLNVHKVMDPHFLRQQQLLFNKVWMDSIPSTLRMLELNEGKEHNFPVLSPKTEVIENPYEIERRLSDFIRNSTNISTYTSIGGIQMIQKYFLDLHKETMKNYVSGKYKGTRWITTVNDEKEALFLKKILNDSMVVRHVPNLYTLTNFAFNDDMFISSVDRMKDGNLMTSLVVSNDPLYLNHYRSIFEEVWKSSQKLEDRLMDIQESISDNISVIYNSEQAIALARKLFESAKQEILIILSSTNAALRLDQNKEFMTLNNISRKGIKVKVLVPMKRVLDNRVTKIVSKYPFIEFKFLPFTSLFLVGTAIIDRQQIISYEIKNDTKKSYSDAIRLCLYIDSTPTALSYGTLFENLWKQTDLYKQLQAIEKLQNDFINIASHELRTPVQSIMGFAEILLKDLGDSPNHKKYVDAIRRNTNRIKELVNRLIDVTQIDNKLLILKTETFDFKALISEVIKEQARMRSEKSTTNRITLKCMYRYDSEWHHLNGGSNQDPVLITGDRIRLSQVMMNLLDNAYEAISLAKDNNGTIMIKIEKILQQMSTINKSKQWLQVSIVDSGSGIHPDIIPQLFTKFTTNTSIGIGLGLYFSKEIIKEHGGKIWAKNNDSGIGSTISFRLPL
ncbi:MAG TPA: HAMP domain-containing sensor histidine kinase [Nitrososphaeraceae archaeon]|nr:HAMP domain-containing sensor histidine kinase [Nitrososphaeraceae archaeon]